KRAGIFQPPITGGTPRHPGTKNDVRVPTRYSATRYFLSSLSLAAAPEAPIGAAAFASRAPGGALAPRTWMVPMDAGSGAQTGDACLRVPRTSPGSTLRGSLLGGFR